MVDLPKIVAGIEKSGFVLEHRVSEMLRAHKWTVINNKYYLDDVQDSAREIDVIAYKVGRRPDFVAYTALIISCKKSDENAWTFLMRDRDEFDPNVDWYPAKVWSNQSVLKHIFARDWKTGYFATLSTLPNLRYLIRPTGHLFAFQEVDKKKGTVQNDKNIFSSVSSLMKAEAYELGRLEGRASKPVVYTFNLISVADTDLITLSFKGNLIEPEHVADARFVFNYIVSRMETASRIHFVNIGSLDRFLKSYNDLHDASAEFFERLVSNFYTNVFSKADDWLLLQEPFTQKVRWPLVREYRARFGKAFGDENIYFRRADDGNLEIEIFYDDSETELLTSNERIQTSFRSALKEVYRYEGPFRFVTAEVPF